MIAFVSGRVDTRSAGYSVIDVGGIGLKLNMSSASLSVLPGEGEQATLHTHLHVREDEITLFGFVSAAEKDAFELLITVSGVGPKVALAVLSTLSPDALAQAVAAEDVALISTVPGVGKKTAQRIVVDLSDRLTQSEGPLGALGPTGGASADARAALQAMGFSVAEIAVALKGAPSDAGAQATLQWALKRLGGGR